MLMSVYDGKKIVSARRMKRAGLIIALIAVAGITVAILFAIFQRGGGSSGFTVKIDNPSKDVHFQMQETVNGNASNILSGEPISKIYPASARNIEAYVSSFSDEELGGSKNMIDTNESRAEQGFYNALVYTVYLSNTSMDKEQEFAYEVKLDKYNRPSNDAYGTFDYLRVAIQTSILESNEMNTSYFALASSTGYGTLEGLEDNRECVSEYENTVNDDNLTVRKPTYIGLSKDGYCESFISDKENEAIVRQELKIPANKTMRFTFISYLEGADYDCRGIPPENSMVLMSLHFGVL